MKRGRTVLRGTRRRKAPSESGIPDSLSAESVSKVYQLDRSACNLHSVPNPKTQNCRDNTYCLARLGQQKWEKIKTTMDKDSKTNALNSERRDVNSMPCGLVNLGNSCYMNSFLQIYFNDPFFRKCIYDWRPVENFVKRRQDNVNIEELMICFQELFATLQITPFEDTSAEVLSKLLRMDNEQQDALEFQLLLFNCIKNMLLQREEWKSTYDIINNRYNGVLVTQTYTCLCGRVKVMENVHNPLCLIIDKAKSFSRAFDAYFKTEVLPDYVCPVCHAKGTTSLSSVVKEPPEVLTIQLNRFTYEAEGLKKDNSLRKRKVHTPLQYPREYVFLGVTFEICAVMVHDGPEADSGHYYDIIKHPDTGKWFIYNDEKITATSTPGVASEKERISKVTPDMKGCYALIYRRKNEMIDSVPQPPEHIREKIALKVEEDFIAQTSAASAISKRWVEIVNKRHEEISDFWDRLEVKNGRDATANPESIVFLPTDLLIDVQNKEFEAVAKAKEEFAFNAKIIGLGNDDSKGSGGSDRDEVLQSIYKVERLNSCSFPLCVHGRVSLDGVCRGEIKAVRREGAEELLLKYSLQMMSSDGSSVMFKTGKDICSECVAVRKADLEFANLLESKEKIVKQLLREKNKRYFHSDGCLWVSTRSLTHYRKLAALAREQRQASTREEFAEISFVARPPIDENFGCTGKNLISNEMAPKSSREEETDADEFGLPDVPSVAGDLINPGSSVRGENRESLSDEKQKSSAEKGCDLVIVKKSDNSEEPCKKRKLDGGLVVNEVDDVPAVDLPSSDSGDTADPCCSLGRASPVVNCSGSMSASPPEVDGLGECCSNEKASKEEETIAKPATSMKTSDQDEEDEAQSDEADETKGPVVFNGDLRCCHGKFDFESYETKERRIVVEPAEWRSLVDGIFDDEQVYSVITDEIPCAECETRFNNKKDDQEEQQRRIKEVKAAVGDLIRGISRRSTTVPPSGVEYTRVICGDFIKNMISRFKSGTRSVGKLVVCQGCILCDYHRLPFLPIADPIGKVVPITLEEWTRIAKAFQIPEDSCDEIALKNGQYVSFCDACFEQHQLLENHKRFVYEKGADIYVRLKGSRDEAVNKKSSAASPPPFAYQRGGQRSTRRAIAKSCMKFRMNSSNTVLQLKQKIYEKTGQTPNDQILYLENRVLCDTDTLESARVDPRELIESPIVLVVQVELSDNPRQLERGFANTALSHY